MIHTSGNDIVKLTPYSLYRKHLNHLLELAKTKGKYVVIIPTGNLGTIKLFPWIVRRYLEYRTRRIRKISLKTVAAAGMKVQYVDFFRESDKDPYALHPELYFSSDYFHPNDAGYQLWMPQINEVLNRLSLIS